LSAARPRLLGGLTLALLAAAIPPADAAGTMTPAAAPPVASIAVQPNCGAPGLGPPPPESLSGANRPTYTIEVIGRGLPPGQEADVVFNPGSAPQAYAGNIDAAGAIDQVIHPYAMPAGTYVVQVQPFTFNVDGGTVRLPAASATFEVPCPAPPPASPGAPPPSPSLPPASPSASPPVSRGSPPPVLNPTLTLSPPVGPPGTIVAVRGSDFPANVSVQVGWSQGIVGTAPPALTTDAHGAFTTTVLVYPHDELGARVLTAVSVPPPGTTFIGFASASFLVVAGAGQPSSFVWRR
jgi:hypothetical protein